MRVSELARRAGVSVTTVRFYAREGLLPAPIKTGRTMAYYDEGHLDAIRSIKRLQKVERLPLAFVKERLSPVGREDGEARGKGAAGATRGRARRDGHARSRPEPNEGMRERVIEAARQLFSRKGYHRTKVSDVTDAVGMGKGTFYLHFADKRELLFRVVDSVVENLLRENARAVEGEVDMARRFRTSVMSFIRTYRSAQQMLHCLRGEAVSEDRRPEEKAREIYEKLAEPVARDLKRGIESGLFRPFETALVSHLAVSLAEALSYWLATHEGVTDEEAVDVLDELMLHGLAARPAPAGGPSDPPGRDPS